MIWRYSSSATVACSWDMGKILAGRRGASSGRSPVRSDSLTMAAVEIAPGTLVLVTGASRGSGEAIARAFAARGCTLGLGARRSGPLEERAAELSVSGHAAL